MMQKNADEVYDSDTWISEMIKLCNPSSVHICTGSDVEHQQLLDQMVADHMLIKLNPVLKPGCYLARSDPTDVARSEKSTFVCTTNKIDAGPNNNWVEPLVMKDKMVSLMTGSMQNKCMYVIPFVMGALGDPHSIYGIQVTDSPYVVVNMGIMTVMGSSVLQTIKQGNHQFVKCIHSTGCSGDGWVSTNGQRLSLKWYSNATKYIVHFPEELTVYSYGSGYGGNALLGKKSVSLRIASYMAKQGGWLAEHMMLIGLTPIGTDSSKTRFIAGAFPSSCGKTNLAMIKSALPEWTVGTLGDDICWLRPGPDGRLYGTNPETGFFGVATDTSEKNNPNAIQTIRSNTIFTNVALTADGDVWWEGLSDVPPVGLIDWTGKLYDGFGPAAHPNSRFTAPIKNCPILYPESNGWFPISAILFGGKRTDMVPLVREAISWNHGVYMGSTICSQQTAAAEGTIGQMRYDPFAMLPFCGYNMADYFGHWIDIGAKLSVRPKIFYVNWFRKGVDGQFLWPGFSHNIRILEWIYNRINSDDNAIVTPIGWIPQYINLDGTDIDMTRLFDVDKDAWIQQLHNDLDYLSMFEGRIGQQLLDENKRMLKALEKN